MSLLLAGDPGLSLRLCMSALCNLVLRHVNRYLCTSNRLQLRLLSTSRSKPRSFKSLRFKDSEANLCFPTRYRHVMRDECSLIVMFILPLRSSICTVSMRARASTITRLLLSIVPPNEIPAEVRNRAHPRPGCAVPRGAPALDKHGRPTLVVVVLCSTSEDRCSRRNLLTVYLGPNTIAHWRVL